MALFNTRNIAFATVWFAYGSVYFLRKPFGVTRNALSNAKQITSSQLGWMDASFFLPYAVGQIFLGNFWEKTNPYKLLGLSMTVAALAMFLFPYCSSWYIMSAMLFVNGLAQSLCWPAVCRVTSSLYSGETATTAFGVLSTSVFAGALLATTVAALWAVELLLLPMKSRWAVGEEVYIQDNLNWYIVYPCCSIIVIVSSLLVCNTSRTVGSTSEQIGNITTDSTAKTTDDKTEKVGWKKILSLPMVVELCVIMFCLKLARYSIYMWLPMYFTLQMEYTEYWSGMLSTVFDIGGVAGSLAIGPIINRLFQGVAVRGCTVFVLLSGLSFLVFTATGGSTICHVICLFLAGAFNSGPDGILAGSIPAEIGKLEGTDLSGAIYGLVNGFGGFGSVIEGPLMGWLSRQYGWNSIIDAIIFASFLGGVLCVRLCMKPVSQTSTGQVQIP